MKPELSRRQRVFISYGRKDGQAAVDWLRTRLRSEGFDPWMDTAELVGGDAWQSKILEAIESSDGFVALISDHSVREGSCCYAEIEAALMSRTGPRIVPVIIKQDESSRGKPLRLLPLHQINLSGFEALSEAQREAGFQQVLAALRGELPTDTALNAAKLRFGRLDFDWLFAGYRRFEGRQWLLDHIDEWVGSGSERALLISAPPGLGKTACMVRWVSEHLPIGAYHFCRHDALDTRDPRKFVASLVHQLLVLPESELPRYRELVLRRLREFSAAQLMIDDPATVMQDLVLHPLRQLDPGRRWVLVIDALDEATDEFRQLLAAAIPTLPESVRVVMTVRSGSGIESLFEPHLVRVMRLDPLGQENLHDLRLSIRARLEGMSATTSWPASRREELIESMIRNSGGNFANVEYHFLEFESGRLSLEGLAAATGGNEAMYLRAMSSILPLTDEPRVDRCLQSIAVLLASSRPMSDSEIAEVTERSLRSIRLDFDRLAACFPLATDGTRRVFHASYAEWLVNPQQPHHYQIDRREGLHMIAGWAARSKTAAAWRMLAQAQLATANPQAANDAAESVLKAGTAAAATSDTPWDTWLSLIREGVVALNRSGSSDRARGALAALIALALEQPAVPEWDALSLVDLLVYSDRVVRPQLFSLARDCPIYVKHWLTKADPVPEGRRRRIRQSLSGALEFDLLVRHGIPGIDVRGHLRGPDAAAADTWRAIDSLRASGGGVIHHATFKHGNLATVVDTIEVTDAGVKVGRILPRMLNGRGFLLEICGPRGGVLADWLPLLHTCGFDMEVIRRAWSSRHGAALSMSAELICVDRTGRSSDYDHSGNMDYLHKDDGAGCSVLRPARWRVPPPVGFRSSLIMRADVTQYVHQACEQVCQQQPALGASLALRCDALEKMVSGGASPDPALERGSKCRWCMFSRELVRGAGCGRDECWGVNIATIPDHVLTLPRLSQRQLEPAVRARGTSARVSDVPLDTLSDLQRGSIVARPALQGSLPPDPMEYLLPAHDPLQRVRFLHIGGTSPAIPEFSNERPYLFVPLQFEVLELPTGGADLSARQWLAGFYWTSRDDPRRSMVDALMAQLGESGVVFHVGPYLRGCIHSVKRHILAARQPGDDSRIAFLESLTGQDGKGGGRLIDLWSIARGSFQHPKLRPDSPALSLAEIAWSEPAIRSVLNKSWDNGHELPALALDDTLGPILKPLPRGLCVSIGLSDAKDNATEELLRDEKLDHDAEGAIGMSQAEVAEAVNRYIRLSGRGDDLELVARARGHGRLRALQALLAFVLMRDHIKHWPVQEAL